MVDAAMLSDRRVSAFNDAERLLLWALRHRVATGDATSPHLAHAFGVLCGAVNGPRTHAALDGLVVALDTHARRPLAFLNWCNRAVTTDEADALDALAVLQAGLPDAPFLERLVFAEGIPVARHAAITLVRHLRDAGLRLPRPAGPGPAGPRGNRDPLTRTLH